MQKNKLPEEAIRQRMEMDGLSARDIEQFFSSGTGLFPDTHTLPAPTSLPVPTPPSSEPRSLKKYEMMRKSNVPEVHNDLASTHAAKLILSLVHDRVLFGSV